MGDDDKDSFRDAMRGVRPLPRRGAPAAPAAPRNAGRRVRAARRAELVEIPAGPDAAALPAAGDTLDYARPGTPRDALRRLRRGQYAPQAEIDLHGLRMEAAQDALRGFVADAAARGLRCVRVIHGKGSRSGAGGPVLKRAVDYWLRRMQPVAAFVSARPADGGTGAVYVLLAGRRSGAR